MADDELLLWSLLIAMHVVIVVLYDWHEVYPAN